MSKIILSNHLSVGKNKSEIVERKGRGHPDTLADSLAERLSAKYSNYTLKNFGAILHHNFDKVGLLGGSSYVRFGKGKMINPIKVLLNGRVSTRFGNTIIPFEKMIISWSKEFLKERLPLIDVDKDLLFIMNISNKSSPGKTEEKGSEKGTRKYWFEPRDLRDLQELKILLSNDTSLGVGFAPMSKLEIFILDLEHRLNSIFSDKNKWMGSDIKILGLCNNSRYSITMCIPQIANYVRNQEEYKKNLESAKKYIFSIAKKHFVEKLDLSINTRDNFKLNELYLTAIGSSIESGDEGLVGRGNRINGLITPMKPMSLEGSCGKNPVYHIGKIYYLAANKIAKKIYKKFNVYNEVYLASQSGRNLVDPWIAMVFLPSNFKSNTMVEELVREEISRIPNLTAKIISEKERMY